MSTVRSLMTGSSVLLALCSAPALAAIDATPPTTTINVAGVRGGGGGYASAVTVTLTAADDAGGAGVARTDYSLDGVTWQPYSAPFVLDTDGDSYLSVRSTDLAGNVEAPAKSQLVRINKAALVGWWKLDANWNGSSIYGNNGYPMNAPTFSTDVKVGTGSGSFNGSSSYVSVIDSPSLKLTSGMTLAAWIKPSDVTQYRQIISKFSYGGYAYQIGLAPTGNIRTDISKDGTSYDRLVTTNAPITPNTWQHVAATFDNGVLKLYVNGVEVAGKTSTVPKLFLGSANLNLGRNSDCIQYFNGLIDDALVYSSALSAGDIQGLYLAAAVGLPTVSPLPSATSAATVTLSGTKPANTAVVVNGTTLVPLDAGTTWKTTYTLAQGINSVSVAALDGQNLSSAPVTQRVVLDSSAPAVTATAPAANALLQTAPGAVSFTLSDAFSSLDFAATLSGAALTNASGTKIAGTWSSSGAGSGGTVKFTPASTLPQGTYSCVINPTDSFANASSYRLAFTIDSTPPAAPVIDPVPAPTNAASKIITGTRSADSSAVTVSCAGAGIGPVSYPSATTWGVEVTGLKEGSNVITASAVDAAGNQSAPSATTVIVDRTSPTVSSTTSGGAYASSQTAALSASEPAVIYYTLDGSVPTTSDSVYVAPISITTSATLRYFARDLAGNVSDVKTDNFVIDTAAPTLALSTLSDGSYTNNDILNIAGTVTDQTVVQEFSINGNPVPLNADGSFTYALALKPGANTVTVAAIDQVGNRSGETRTVTLDQTAPALAIGSPADNSMTGSALLTVGGSVDETSRVVVRLGDNVQAAAQTGAAFSAYLSLIPGYNTIEVTATDLAGNQSTLKRTVLYDNQKPSLSINAPNQDLRINQSNLTIKGSVADSLTAVGVTIKKDSETFTPPVVNGSYEQTVSLDQEKTYDIVVTATNEVGTSTTVQRNVIYDITPPVLGIDPPVSPTSQTGLTITGIREAGTAVTVVCATATVGEIVYPTDTTWQADLSGLAEGGNLISAASTDAAGNAVTATATVVRATKPPQITLTATPSVLWPPQHKMVPVKISGGVTGSGAPVKSVSVSVSDEYGKIAYKNLKLGGTIMLESWRNANDADGRKYTITVAVTDAAGVTTTKTTTVTVPHDKGKGK
ncbi:chitobiase/beta-hexosaminidase C-terminal domain-containing protein [Geomonas sp. Red69]|uniref:LamG-like jellyroll fold domain-containing protein n=1 Tax=Geomonas diazotrophica TaxID=2843197 RepID=UPI001C0F5740|nr:LamG-like jellyroll fold domain-containing protein [Geomonas diazotrophica]MBU5636883.1 chitobiase/beta-hexosaminidase C-terminal domain-containing protein [Geomonas diazotrophica]